MSDELLDYDDAVMVVDQIRFLAEALDRDVDSDADVMTPTERIDLYAACDLAALALGIVLRKWRHDAAVALADLGVKRGDVYNTGLTTVRRTTSRTGGDHWRGHALCDALAIDAIDPDTGEKVRAVPVHVMRDVVAGCARDELTSSRWRTEGLAGRVNVNLYHTQRPVAVDDVSIVRTANPPNAGES